MLTLSARLFENTLAASRAALADGTAKVRSAARQRNILHSTTASSDLGEIGMAKGNQKGNREAKKPKKEKIKTIAAAPSQKTGGWQPALGSGKKK